MPRENRDVKELRTRAICSLVLAVELFNRPYDGSRKESVVIFLHHAFEMLLKAIIKNKTGVIHEKGEMHTYRFRKCVDIAA
ncbi:DUF3644 domain-containing protein, partial [Desulfovibrio sp.]